MTADTSPRPYNDRLFLHLIRKAGQMSKAELTRASGLSAQSATVIVNRLVLQGFLSAGDTVRGRIGQPSTPYALNPDGATSIGVKVGRRSLEVVSMTFDYRILDRVAHRYAFPLVDDLRSKITGGIETLMDGMTPAQRARLTGIGLALPDQLADWEETIGAPAGAMADWRDTDLRAEITAHFDVPTTVLNDAASACLAELETGNPENYDSFAYIYVGTFIGGGVALGGRLFTGGGHAGAIGSLPAVRTAPGPVQQMIDTASLHMLEARTAEAGLSSDAYFGAVPLDAATEVVFHEWLAIAADNIATACVSAQAFLAPQAIIIDTSLAPPLKDRLLTALQQAIGRLDVRGLDRIIIVPGTAGSTARVTGSGILPFQAGFCIDTPT